jgi:hypothetical protein
LFLCFKSKLLPAVFKIKNRNNCFGFAVAAYFELQLFVIASKLGKIFNKFI